MVAGAGAGTGAGAGAGAGVQSCLYTSVGLAMSAKTSGKRSSAQGTRSSLTAVGMSRDADRRERASENPCSSRDGHSSPKKCAPQ